MTSALRWAAMRAILMFHNCEGQSHKTVSTNHSLFEEKGEPKRIRTEVPLLTSLTDRPNRLTESARTFRCWFWVADPRHRVGASVHRPSHCPNAKRLASRVSYFCFLVGWGGRLKWLYPSPSKWYSSGAVWESRWPSWAVRPNEPSGFRGRKDLLHRASALVTTCP